MKAIRIIWGIAAILIALYLVAQRPSRGWRGREVGGYKAGDIGIVVMLATSASLFFHKKKQKPKSRRYTYNSIKEKLQIDRFNESEVEVAAKALYNSDFNKGKPVIEIDRSGKRTQIEREDESH